jgi:hypothetical protein
MILTITPHDDVTLNHMMPFKQLQSVTHVDDVMVVVFTDRSVMQFVPHPDLGLIVTGAQLQ